MSMIAEQNGRSEPTANQQYGNRCDAIAPLWRQQSWAARNALRLTLRAYTAKISKYGNLTSKLAHRPRIKPIVRKKNKKVRGISFIKRLELSPLALSA